MYAHICGLMPEMLDEGGEILPGLANASALLALFLRDINWVGFYLMKNGMLLLGPFQGKPAVTRIRPGEGVCGTAVLEKRAQRVDDVHACTNHIACDMASSSEIVVPMIKSGEVLGVLDIDSPLRRGGRAGACGFRRKARRHALRRRLRDGILTLIGTDTKVRGVFLKNAPASAGLARTNPQNPRVAPRMNPILRSRRHRAGRDADKPIGYSDCPFLSFAFTAPVLPPENQRSPAPRLAEIRGCAVCYDALAN